MNIKTNIKLLKHQQINNTQKDTKVPFIYIDKYVKSNEVNDNIQLKLIHSKAQNNIPSTNNNPPKENIPIEIAEKWDLYGLHTKSKNYQIFTYSYDDRLYKEFGKDLNETVMG